MTYIDDHVALLKQQREEYQKQNHNFMLDAAFSALERVFKPSVDTSALATVTQINDLNTALAGQSQQLAELQQAVLILAKSAKGVETGIEVIKKQTAPRVKDWKSIRKEMNVIWRDIIDDTTFFNADARSTAQGRGLQSLFSFGTAAPALMHAAKTECRSHIKQVRSAIAKLKQLFEYAQLRVLVTLGFTWIRSRLRVQRTLGLLVLL